MSCVAIAFQIELSPLTKFQGKKERETYVYKIRKPLRKN